MSRQKRAVPVPQHVTLALEANFNEMLWYQPRKRSAPQRLLIGNTGTRDYDFGTIHDFMAPVAKSSPEANAGTTSEEEGSGDDREVASVSSDTAGSDDDPSIASTSTYFTAEDGSDGEGSGARALAAPKREGPLTVTVRLARCKMPYRWREPLAPFDSVLFRKGGLRAAASSCSSATRGGACGLDATTVAVLTRALSCDEVSDDSWLGSSLIDLVLSRFAR